jgi:putative membrane protein
MTYLYLKSIHIIFVVSWMAGLFYIVRLFIYHTEANNKPEPDRTILQMQFSVMEKRLWNIITIPAMILTLISGVSMIWMNTALLKADWMQVKLGFVAGLLLYHFACQHIIKQLGNGVFKWSSSQLRIWNELATILLVAIVFTVILKTAIDWFYATVALILFAIIIMSAVRIYKYYRRKDLGN